MGWVLGGLVPGSVRYRETGGGGSLLPLSADPYHAVGAESANRRGEFAVARDCARRALAELGLPDATVPRGEDGAPCWPDGFVGSITHCAGYRAAAVARRSEIAALGIDAEPLGRMSPRVLARIALPAERTMLDRLPTDSADGPQRWGRWLFTAKEAVYKAWYPLTGAWLGFHDVLVDVDATTERFTAYLPEPSITVDGRPVDRFHGRYAFTAELVVSAIAVPATDPPSGGGSEPHSAH